MKMNSMKYCIKYIFKAKQISFDNKVLINIRWVFPKTHLQNFDYLLIIKCTNKIANIFLDVNVYQLNESEIIFLHQNSRRSMESRYPARNN